MQQISKGYQCFDESLIVYLLVCLDARFTMGCFKIVHISIHDNLKDLAQQASGYYVNHGVLHFYQLPMLILANIGKAELELTTSASNETFVHMK